MTPEELELKIFNAEQLAFQAGIEYQKEATDEFAIDFLDSIREYERESRNLICFDERDSKELLEIFKKEKGL